MKKGYRKCSWCETKGKHKYKKGRLRFCTPEHKQEYLDNHLPTLIKETQKKFNSLVASKGVCEKDGKSFEVMQCSHVWSIGAYPNLRFDILNALCMDGGCHNWWWHLEPMESRDWFTKKYPERDKYLRAVKEIVKPWSVDEVKEIRKAIKEKNLSGLIRFKEEYKTSP